ncbi:unnamed protein product, partial [Mesorhabditis spiculigera]
MVRNQTPRYRLRILKADISKPDVPTHPPSPVKVAQKKSDTWEDDDAFGIRTIKEGSGSPRASTSWNFDEGPKDSPAAQSQQSLPAVNGTGGMSKVASLLSLADYQAEEDSFAKYDREHANDDFATSPTQNSSACSENSAGSDERDEPRPPARESDDDDIERLLAAGKEARITPTSQVEDGSSPMPDGAGDQAATPEADREPIEIPSDAEGEPDPEVALKFQRLFERKAQGYNINDQLLNSRTFTNPSGYVIIKEKSGINELGTNFPKHIYDPTIFPEDCFYDKLSEAQNRMMTQEVAGPSSEKKKEEQ